MKKTTTRIVAVAGSAALLTGVGVAYASWTTQGTGNGSATAATDVALQVAGTTAAGLVPNTSRDITITVTNPNEYKVALSSLALDTAGITTAVSGCSASSVTYTAPASLAAVVPAKVGSTNGTQTFTGTISMSNAATDECKTALFNVALKAVGQSAP